MTIIYLTNNNKCITPLTDFLKKVQSTVNKIFKNIKKKIFLNSKKKIKKHVIEKLLLSLIYKKKFLKKLLNLL